MLRKAKRKEDDYAFDDNLDGKAPPRKSSKKDSDDESDDDLICKILKNRRVSGRNWQGKVVVDIREFYVKDGKQLPKRCALDVVEGPGYDFELVVVILAARHSPNNLCNGCWRSVWNIEFKDESQTVEVRGKLQVGAHYFEEGNVQLDAKHECKDSTIFQAPEDCAIAISTIICHHETEYLTSLQASYSNLPDTTFKDLRRKLPITRTLFPWHNTLQFSLTRDVTKELGIKK